MAKTYYQKLIRPNNYIIHRKYLPKNMNQGYLI